MGAFCFHSVAFSSWQRDELPTVANGCCDGRARPPSANPGPRTERANLRWQRRDPRRRESSAVEFELCRRPGERVHTTRGRRHGWMFVFRRGGRTRRLLAYMHDTPPETYLNTRT